MHKKYLFNDSELELIQFMKSNPPVRIWLDVIYYVFEYDDFHIQMMVNCAERINLDFPDLKERHFLDQYVMVTNFKKISDRFQPQGIMSELLIENQTVKEIFIVRTMLCFSEHTQIETNSYNSDSFQINPNLFNSEDKKIKFRALADVGLSIEFRDKTVDCFIVDNDDDFLRNYDSYSFVPDLEGFKQTNYQFIKV